jgi:hypothetical protein
MARSPDLHQWSKFNSLVAIFDSTLAGARRGIPRPKEGKAESPILQIVRHKRRTAQILAVGALAGLAGCQSGERTGGPLIMEVDATAVSMLTNVNENAQKCWIRSGDKEFQGLVVIPELDTRAGNPRLLVVERGKAAGLPKLVIEASGKPVKLATYGPLTASPVSARINDDIIAWTTGRENC